VVMNPDCGLKTRQWKEVSVALRNIGRAAYAVREKLTQRRPQPIVDTQPRAGFISRVSVSCAPRS